MPELRSGARRGRTPKRQQQPQPPPPPPPNRGDLNQEGEAIATRTRRRRAAAAAAVVPPVIENVNVGTAAQAVVPEAEGVPVVRAEREEVAEKPMGEFESGDKGNAGDDEGNNSPIPDTVRSFIIRILFVACFVFRICHFYVDIFLIFQYRVRILDYVE